MNKHNARMAVDVALSVLIILSMLIQLTGVTLHELFGALFFVLLVCHLTLSYKWIRAVSRTAGRKKLRMRTTILLIMGMLLTINCVVLAISSVMISRTLASVGFASSIMSGLWRDIHTASSYILCVLVLTHLAMHWSQIFSWVRLPYNPERRQAIGKGVGFICGAGILALGISYANAQELILKSNSTLNALKGNADNDQSSNNMSESIDNKPLNDVNTSEDEIIRTSQEAKTDGSDIQKDSSQYEVSPTTENNSATETVVTGICPLCKKHCPLSEPQCDKPSLAGLI